MTSLATLARLSLSFRLGSAHDSETDPETPETIDAAAEEALSVGFLGDFYLQPGVLRPVVRNLLLLVFPQQSPAILALPTTVVEVSPLVNAGLATELRHVQAMLLRPQSVQHAWRSGRKTHFQTAQQDPCPVRNNLLHHEECTSQ